jgi:hypothetical protein
MVRTEGAEATAQGDPGSVYMVRTTPQALRTRPAVDRERIGAIERQRTDVSDRPGPAGARNFFHLADRTVLWRDRFDIGDHIAA